MPPPETTRASAVPVTRLILIEGMIGSGKTSTADRVANWLTRRGEGARAFLEGAADNPIRTRAVDQLLAASAQAAGPPGRDREDLVPGGAGRYAADQWRRLAERCLRGRQTIILESMFLQNSVMPAFIDCAPAGTVDATFAAIERQVAPAEPLLIYLRPTDIAATIARAHQARGEPWSSRNLAFVASSPWARRRHLHGQDAVVQLYQAWEIIVTRLYDQYSFPKLMVTDPQHDWQAALTRICAAVRS